MSYPSLFSVPGMRDLAEKIDALRFNWRSSDDQTFPAPKGDGTGSANSIAQASFHNDYVGKLIADKKHSWRDLARMRINNLFSVKKPEELQEHILGMMAMLAEWHEDLNHRA